MYYYQVVYSYVNDTDIRLRTIADKLGIGIQTVTKSLDRYIEEGFKELVLARDTKTMEHFVQICTEDHKNKNK